MVAGVVLLAPSIAGAQPAEGTASFRVFLKGSAIGGEEVTVRRTPAGTTITSTGRLAAPLDLVTRQCVLRYDANWRPIDLTVDAIARGAGLAIKTTFADGKATSEITQAGAPTTKTDTVAADTLVLPNLFFSAYEALAMRLANIPDGASFQVYVAPQAEITVKQNARSTQKIETARRVIDVRAYALTFQNPGNPLEAIVWTDETGRLLKFEVPAQTLIFVREDLSSVASRALVVSRDGDQSVRIPGNGFNLAGTLSQPSGQPPPESKGRYPAIVLVGGAGPTDRDETVSGISVFGLLATPLADAGYYVLRYDRRGVGQSGGRAETATLAGLCRRRPRGRLVPAQAQGRRCETHRAGRLQRRRAGVVAGGQSRRRPCRRRPGGVAIGSRRRARARAAAVPAGQDEPARGGACDAHRPAETDSGRGAGTGHLGRRAGGAQEAGEHGVVPEFSALQSGQRDAQGEAAAADSARRHRPAGPGRTMPIGWPNWPEHARRCPPAPYRSSSSPA